jgi:hypothetical protein
VVSPVTHRRGAPQFRARAARTAVGTHETRLTTHETGRHARAETHGTAYGIPRHTALDGDPYLERSFLRRFRLSKKRRPGRSRLARIGDQPGPLRPRARINRRPSRGPVVRPSRSAFASAGRGHTSCAAAALDARHQCTEARQADAVRAPHRARLHRPRAAPHGPLGKHMPCSQRARAERSAARETSTRSHTANRLQLRRSDGRQCLRSDTCAGRRGVLHGHPGAYCSPERQPRGIGTHKMCSDGVPRAVESQCELEMIEDARHALSAHACHV